MISKVYAGVARCSIFPICVLCFILGAVLAFQSARHQVFFEVFLRTINPAYSFENCLAIQSASAFVLFVIAISSVGGVLKTHPKWFPWSLPWAFLCSFVAAMLYVASGKLKLDTNLMFNNNQQRANFIHVFPKNCTVIQHTLVYCPSMGNMYCESGTLKPDPDHFAQAATVWDDCESGWNSQLESIGNDGAVCLVIFASLLWGAAIAGILCVLVVKRTFWHKSFASLHDQVFRRLVAEWVETDEQILCVAEKDLHHADFETLRFLGIAALSIVGLPIAILFLPVYMEYKRREYVETVLFLTTHRLLLKNGNQLNSVSCKLGAIRDLSKTPDGTIRSCFCNMGTDGIKIKMKQAHVLRGMPSCDTLLITGIKNADEFLQKWQRLADEALEANRSRAVHFSSSTIGFSSDSIDVSDFAPETQLQFSFSAAADEAHSEPHSYWTSHRKYQSGLPEILCITMIPSQEVVRRWKISSETILCLQLRFDGTTWEVFRRPADFISLHLTLISKLRLRGNWMQNFPKLPKRYWAKLAPREVDEMDDMMRSMLHAYLDACFKIPVIRDSLTFANFVEVSTFSFRGNLGVGYVKWREGYIWKYKKGECLGALCRTCLARIPLRCINFATCRAQLCKRWMILRQDHLIFMEDQRATTNKSVLMFDHTICVQSGREATGYDDGLFIYTQDGDWQLRCGSTLQASLWREAIEEAIRKSPFCEVQPYGSTFPPRKECSVELLCDGKPFFQSVHEALEEAENDIYICDWWLTAEMSLLRNSEAEVEESQIVKILHKKADAGVKVFIHVYKEMPVLYIDSAHLKEVLGKHDNISFLRHPDHLPFSEGKMTWLWSHHEKIVCVDQAVAFIGGMDLCWGRYDTDRHHLHDYGGGDLPTQFPGKDYHNPRIKDFTDIRLAKVDLINRTSDPRMPWHDVSVRLEGPIVSDIARHFLQLWNHVIRDKDQRNVQMRKYEPYIRQVRDNSDDAPKTSFIMHARDVGDRLAAFGKKVQRRGRRAVARFTSFDEETPFYDPNANQTSSIELPRSDVRKLGARDDLSGPLLQPFCRPDDTDEIQAPLASRSDSDIPQSSMPRRKSRAISEASSLRKSHVTHPKSRVRDDLEAHSDIESPTVRELRGSVFYPQLRTRHHSSSIRRTFTHGVYEDDVQVQLLRQCSSWSYGTNESSVHECYCQSIAAAKHYIYIENQFFITSTHRSSEVGGNMQRNVQNRVGQVIVDRILQAVQRSEDFRVYVVLPALPGFTGLDLRNVDTYALRYTMQMQFLSICRGPNSIIGTLEEELPRCGFAPSTWRNHIGFFCLKHAETLPNGKFQAEQIYVHSKILLVDDEKMICGSANINDRSLISGRDSEICVLVTHKEFVTQARTRLWHEHFGLLGGDDMPRNCKDIADGLHIAHDVAAWTLWHTFGKSNAASFFDHCAYSPSSEITTYEQWQSTVNRSLLPKAKHSLVLNFGRVCEFPYDFLKKENILLPAPLSASVAPCDLIFT